MKRTLLSILDEGPHGAAWQMERDSALLAAAEEPCVRLYSWAQPAITYGHFIDPAAHLVTHAGWEMARRPTGGGLLCHMGDCTFSIITPLAAFPYTTLEGYRVINEAVRGALREAWGIEVELAGGSERGAYCMATTTQYDLMLAGRKVGGSAQRRTRQGLLHQMTLFVQEPPWEHLLELFVEPEAVEAMRQGSSWLGVEGDRRGFVEHLARNLAAVVD